MEIGIKLRQLRDRKRLSSREVASSVDVQQSTYLSWERDTTYPSIKYLAPLALALEVCPISFMAYLFEQISLKELLEITETVPNLLEAVNFYKNQKGKLGVENHINIGEELLKLNNLILKNSPPPLF